MGWSSFFPRKVLLDERCHDHERNPIRNPLDMIMAEWEEMNWAWWEEVKARRRDLARRAGPEAVPTVALLLEIANTIVDGRRLYQHPTFDTVDPLGY